MRDTEFPIVLKPKMLYAARRRLLVDDQHLQEDGVTPYDLTGYAFSGDVRVTVDPASTKLASLTFNNDLPNGIIRASISAADATAILAGATAVDAAGRKQAYADIKATPPGGEAEQWYVAILPLSNVVTP